MDPARPTVYGAPRRFDLATMFTVSLAYALLFAAMRAMKVDAFFIAVVAMFITGIGICQALLFGGKYPREASLVGGVLIYLVFYLIFMIRDWMNVGGLYLSETLFGLMSVFCGVIHGYLAGVLVGGVFLIADYLRKSVRRWRREPVVTADLVEGSDERNLDAGQDL